MKLKEIPKETVVHTPTEEEAKELLAILHENGWTWNIGQSLIEKTRWHNAYSCYCLHPDRLYVTWSNILDKNFLTLLEFKSKYCEEEKPQPKFKVGDRVKIKESYYKEELHGRIGIVTSRATPFSSFVEIDKAIYQVSDRELEPYTEPETKLTEDMEAKGKEQGEKGNNSGNSQLNLCELLREHEEETFFSLAYGEVVLDEIRRGTQRGDSPDFLCVHATSFDSGTIIVNPNGKLRNAGVVDLVPSRELYQQYPLDPYTAWMKWQSEQKKYTLVIACECPDREHSDFIKHINFRTPADRDQCIEEINAVIEKHINK